MAGTQILEPSTDAFQSVHQQETGWEGEDQGLEPGTPIYDADTSRGDLIAVPNAHPPCFFLLSFPTVFQI